MKSYLVIQAAGKKSMVVVGPFEGAKDRRDFGDQLLRKVRERNLALTLSQISRVINQFILPVTIEFDTVLELLDQELPAEISA